MIQPFESQYCPRSGRPKWAAISYIKGIAMDIDKIVDADWRTASGREFVTDTLSKIKPLSKYAVDGKQIPLVKVERLIWAIVEKYKVDVVWVFVSHDDAGMRYTISIRGDQPGVTYKIVHGITLYEVFSKSAIIMWHLVKKKIAKEREKK